MSSAAPMAIDDPLPVPRAYQDEILAAAQRGNVIAVLDTGTGKTLIAVNLIKWVALATRRVGQGKQLSVFLVPTVPLVHQQSRTISSLTSLTVKPLSGDAALDFWDHARWTREINPDDIDVLVLVPEIFRMMLSHAYLAMSDVQLIVLDEVHHCKKRHPYSVILEEYYHTIPPGHQRPRILGLTASPIWSLGNAEGSLRTLEAITQSKIIAVKHHVDELAAHAPKPEESVVFYRPPWESNPTRLFSVLSTRYGELLRAHPEVKWDKIAARAVVVLETLGGAGMDWFLVDQLGEVVKAVRTGVVLGMGRGSGLVQERWREVERLVEERRGRLGEVVGREAVTEKVDQLIAVLIEHHRAAEKKRAAAAAAATTTSTPDPTSSIGFQAIIFVQMRNIAFTLSHLLTHTPFLPWLTVRTLVGHSSSHPLARSTAGTTQNFQQQQATVREFREGRFNVLVSTSVGEEGLDFPACELVVRFDGIQSVVGYVQSRGRARRRESKYVVMIDETSEEDFQKFKKYSESEPLLKQAYQASRGLVQEYNEDDSDINPADRLKRERYPVPSTGAVLTYSESIPLVQQVCSLLPCTDGQEAAAPRYTLQSGPRGFVAILELPSASALPVEELRLEGTFRTSKQEAKRAVAFQACKLMHQRGLLNDRLLPFREPKGMSAEDAYGRLLGEDLEIEVEVEVHATWGDLWADGDAPVYLHPIEVDGRALVGVIGAEAVDVSGQRMKLYHGHSDDEDHSVVAFPPARRIDFGAIGRQQGLEILDKLTREIVCRLLRPNWRRDEKLSCLMAPLGADGKIDWDLTISLSETLLSGDWRDPGKYLAFDSMGHQVTVEKTRSDLTPYSKPVRVEQQLHDMETAVCREDGFATYLDYAREKLLHTRAEKDMVITTATPMLQVRMLTKRRNHLVTVEALRKVYSKEENDRAYGRGKQQQFVVIQPHCKITKIPLDLRDSIMYLPAVLRFMTDRSRLLRGTERLNFRKINQDLLQEAMTPPAAAYGVNYQRLETLGDNVLQICTVMYVFNTFPHKHEGACSILKHHSVSNKLLRARAMLAGLGGMISMEQVLVGRWEFPTQKHYTEDKKHEKRKIQRKWLQDSVEASLGAAWLTGGIPLALEIGKQLDLCFGGTLPWIERWPVTPRLDLETPPAMKRLEKDLGYTFKNPKLLQAALTHPTHPGLDTGSYQRLEYLGDSVVDFFVVRKLYHTYPEAGPGEMTWMKDCIICNVGLGKVSSMLGLHKYLLIAGSKALMKSISDSVEMLEKLTPQQIMDNIWEFHPAKVLNDIFESTMGAIWIDCKYDLPTIDKVLERLTKPMFDAVIYSHRRDPIADLIFWAHREWKCQSISFKVIPTSEQHPHVHNIEVIVHGVALLTFGDSNRYVAKCSASRDALKILKDEREMVKLCSCRDDAMDIFDEPKDYDEDDYLEIVDAELGAEPQPLVDLASVERAMWTGVADADLMILDDYYAGRAEVGELIEL